MALITSLLLLASLIGWTWSLMLGTPALPCPCGVVVARSSLMLVSSGFAPALVTLSRSCMIAGWTSFMGLTSRGGGPRSPGGCIGWGDGVMGCAGGRGHNVLVRHAERPHHEFIVLHLQASSKDSSMYGVTSHHLHLVLAVVIIIS